MNTYGVTMVKDGITYNFHVPTKILARNLVIGMQGVISYKFTEQTHTGTSVEYREMPREEEIAMFSIR